MAAEVPAAKQKKARSGADTGSFTLGRFTVFQEKSMPLTQWQNYTKGARSAALGAGDSAADPVPSVSGIGSSTPSLPTPHAYPSQNMAGIVTPRAATAAAPRPGHRRVYKPVPVTQASFEHAVAALSTVRDYMFTLSVGQGLTPPVPAARRGGSVPNTPVPGDGPRPVTPLGTSTSDPARPPRATAGAGVDMEALQAARRKAEARARALEAQVKALQESLTVSQQREARASIQRAMPPGTG